MMTFRGIGNAQKVRKGARDLDQFGRVQIGRQLRERGKGRLVTKNRRRRRSYTSGSSSTSTARARAARSSGYRSSCCCCCGGGNRRMIAPRLGQGSHVLHLVKNVSAFVFANDLSQDAAHDANVGAERGILMRCGGHGRRRCWQKLSKQCGIGFGKRRVGGGKGSSLYR
jgi:hypothetical protein